MYFIALIYILHLLDIFKLKLCGKDVNKLYYNIVIQNVRSKIFVADLFIVNVGLIIIIIRGHGRNVGDFFFFFVVKFDI